MLPCIKFSLLNCRWGPSVHHRLVYTHFTCEDMIHSAMSTVRETCGVTSTHVHTASTTSPQPALLKVQRHSSPEEVTDERWSWSSVNNIWYHFLLLWCSSDHVIILSVCESLLITAVSIGRFQPSLAENHKSQRCLALNSFVPKARQVEEDLLMSSWTKQLSNVLAT